MIPATFSMSYWNLTSKVLLLRMEFCLVTNMTLCLYLVWCSPLLSLWVYFALNKMWEWITCSNIPSLIYSPFLSLYITFCLFLPCISGSSFLCLSAPWSRLSSRPGYLMYYFSLQGLRVEMKYGGQASTGMLIFCVITLGWGLGLSSVSINLCFSLAPAAFWNPTQPTHHGETLTHDLSHR